MKGKGIHSRSIFVQLLVFSLLASLVPTLLISIFLFYKLDRTAQAEVQDYHDQITSQYMKNIEEKLQQYRNSLEVIANNTVILNTLTDETLNPYDKGELVSKEVNNSLLLEKQSEVRNCMIYSSVQDCKIYGRRASMMQQASREVSAGKGNKRRLLFLLCLKRFGTDSVSGERYRRAGYRTSEPLTAGNH